MKLLMIYADFFGYKTAIKNWELAEDISSADHIEKAIVGFIQVEMEDKENAGKVITKLIKNLKWLAGKNNTQKIVLHSFAHLSNSKAEPEFVSEILIQAKERLTNAGYEVYKTPVGYFFDLEIKAPGFSLARVFKDF